MRWLKGLRMKPTGEMVLFDYIANKPVYGYVDGLGRRWMAFHRFDIFGRVERARILAKEPT